ncbi:MAG: PilZ domain-containing protein [Deltaproteobacteria bacterium]|nr:PilZ domain-containing protein [Deltaproteobacteria bacterium]
MRNLVLLLGVGLGGVLLILTLKFIQSLMAYRSRSSQFNYRFAIPGKVVEIGKEERRQHARALIRLPVSIETAEGTITAETKDISLGGAFICCRTPLPPKEKFPLALTLPHGDSLALFAEVIWSNSSVPDEKIVNRGMGIRFVLITDQDREILNDLVSTHLGRNVE